MARTSVQTNRPRRTPVGTRNRISVSNQEPGYVYRVVNDLDDRISQLQSNGWQMVDAADTKVGDSRVDQISSLGSKASVSVGQGVKAYVMRIEKDFWEEDQRAKQAQVDALEQTMKKDAKRAADYGSGIELS